MTSRSEPHDSRRISLGVARESLGFAAAHFSIIAGVSETLHGHNYRVAVSVDGQVSAEGTVLDFAVLKEAIRAECAALDHRMLLPTRSPDVRVQEAEGEVEVRHGDRRFIFPRGDVALLPIPNTTCECLADHLLDAVRRRLGEVPVRLGLTVEESPGQGATARETDRG